jgi:hypothetical protein
VATIEVTIWGGLAVAGTLTTPLLKGPCWLPVRVLVFAKPVLGGPFSFPSSVLANDEHFVSVEISQYLKQLKDIIH